MKIKGFIVLIVTLAIMLGSCAKNAIQSSKMVNNIDSVSYALGIVNYNSLTADSVLNPVMIAKAMIDGIRGNPAMKDEYARTLFSDFINKRKAEIAAKQVEATKILYKDYNEQNKAFLAQNKERKGVIVTPSGLQYEVIKMGTGPKPTKENTVKVHYVGTLIDGKKFDSSIDRKEPAEFPVSGIIQGMSEALQLMPVGSKFKIYLPENLAYGEYPQGQLIKPFSTLIFEVELIDIVK
ncbi:MAG: FKBP-type peptidyl-prolyl cis-trans isomerase [Bacteroidia bacterium]|nr:FKBP-type peptidyl-prolyl cis-trans isomerase [Bacteroidia bacterium]